MINNRTATTAVTAEFLLHSNCSLSRMSNESNTYFPATAQKNVNALPRPTETESGNLSLRVGAKSEEIAKKQGKI